jgi:tryptophan synthase alpha chain
MADGPVIQRASERALAHHVSLHHVLDMVREFRQRDNDTPVVLMGYLNPVEVMGYSEFARAAGDAGVDGVLTVDLPPEEAEDFVAALTEYDIAPIFLVAPTTNDERIQKICAAASGYVYYVSLKGVTGAGSLDVDSVAEKVSQIRRHTQLPIGVGFGIKDATSAAKVAGVADAVVVGSALIQIIENNIAYRKKMIEQVSALVSDMRRAMDK